MYSLGRLGTGNRTLGLLSFTFVNPPCVCDMCRGDSSCSNKGKFGDDDDELGRGFPRSRRLRHRSKDDSKIDLESFFLGSMHSQKGKRWRRGLAVTECIPEAEGAASIKEAPSGREVQRPGFGLPLALP